MFAPQIDTEVRLKASEQANLHLKLGNQSLALRIRLQRLVDDGNKLPLSHNDDVSTDCKLVTNKILNLMKDISNLLEDQIPINLRNSNDNKRSRYQDTESNADNIWDDISRPQKILCSNWRNVVDKFHARAHFGSEHVKSKLKTFNQSIWDQVSL